MVLSTSFGIKEHTGIQSFEGSLHPWTFQPWGSSSASRSTVPQEILSLDRAHTIFIDFFFLKHESPLIEQAPFVQKWDRWVELVPTLPNDLKTIMHSNVRRFQIIVIVMQNNREK